MAGKKTYLLAGGVVLVLLSLVAAGRLTPATGPALLVFTAAGFGVTFRAALQRHQAEVVAILQGTVQIGAAVASHNVSGAVKAAEAIAPQGMELAQEINQEKGS
jgi:hypothetical protein